MTLFPSMVKYGVMTILVDFQLVYMIEFIEEMVDAIISRKMLANLD